MSDRPMAEWTRGELVEWAEALSRTHKSTVEKLDRTRAERDDLENKLATTQARLSAIMSMHKVLEHTVLAILRLEKSP